MSEKIMTQSEKEKSEKLLRLLFTIFSIGLGVAYLFHIWTTNGDLDYLWHTLLADYMWKYKTLPVQDYFSWRSIEMGYTEIAHSWLGSLLIGTVVRFFVNNGYTPLLGGRVFSFLSYISCLLVVRATFFRKQRLGAFPVVCLILAITYRSVRMQNISYILLVLILYVLFKSKDWKKLLALPVLMLLCANIHGGTVVLFLGVILVYTIWQFIPKFSIGYFEHKPIENKPMKFAYVGACVFSAIAVCVNPYGWKLYTYFMHVEKDNFAAKHIVEWLPIATTMLAFWIMAAILAVILLQKKTVPLLEYGILAGFFVLSWKYRRFFDYAYISSIPILMTYEKNFAEFFSGVQLSEKKNKIVKHIKNALTVAMLSLAIILPCTELLIISVALRNTSGEVYAGGMLTDEEIEYLSEKNFQRPFNSYDVGAPLMYAGFKSFIDSRADLFVGSELEDMGKLVYQQGHTEELDAILDKYAFDAVIVQTDAFYAFENYISSKDDWVLGYKDDKLTIYEYVGAE